MVNVLHLYSTFLTCGHLSVRYKEWLTCTQSHTDSGQVSHAASPQWLDLTQGPLPLFIGTSQGSNQQPSADPLPPVG